MKKIPSWLMVTVGVVLAVLGGLALVAQDKYTVQVPNGLAFSEFRGYEDWQVVAVSHPGDKLNVIVANPAMIDVYRAGVPGNGKPFPDGSKIAKIAWQAKQSTEAPFAVSVPDILAGVGFIVKDSGRFPDTGGWDMPSLTMTPRPIGSRPIHLYSGTTPSAGFTAIRERRQKITFSQPTGRGERRIGLSSLLVW